MFAFRYFFDPGSGTCLWSANPAARAAFGYPADHHALPLSAAARATLDALLARFDTSLDMSDPGGTGGWSAAERDRFRADARAALDLLRRELPAETFTLLDET